MNNLVDIQNIEKYYGNRSNVTKAIDNISFTVKKGEFVGVMGPSGSGKTTLLNCISTIDTVTSGKIFINDQDITKLKRNGLAKFRREELGFIFQDFNLLDTLTAYENIALALTINKVPASKIDERVKDVASKLEIQNELNKYPIQMSGGQKQRVACARALVTNPSLILADEPTGSLDPDMAQKSFDLIRSLRDQFGKTILIVTHNLDHAKQCDRIVSLKSAFVN